MASNTLSPSSIRNLANGSPVSISRVTLIPNGWHKAEAISSRRASFHSPGIRRGAAIHEVARRVAPAHGDGVAARVVIDRHGIDPALQNGLALKLDAAGVAGPDHAGRRLAGLTLAQRHGERAADRFQRPRDRGLGPADVAAVLNEKRDGHAGILHGLENKSSVGFTLRKYTPILQIPTRETDMTHICHWPGCPS